MDSKNNTLSIYNTDNKIDSTILDNKAITERYVCRSEKILFMICQDCKIVYRVSKRCKARTCSYCQGIRQKQLYFQYINDVLTWKVTKEMKINFLTITFKNVPGINKDWLNGCDKKLKLFIRRLQAKYTFESGFINKEMTWSQEEGYHYHYHLLFYGKNINLKDPSFNLSNIWRNITKNSYIVKLLSNFTNASHSLNYLLKYVCKTTENNEAMQLYYDLTKKKRYFQTFGKTYGKKQLKTKLPLKCYQCYGDLTTNYSKFNSKIFDLVPEWAKEYSQQQFLFFKLDKIYKKQEFKQQEYEQIVLNSFNIYDKLGRIDNKIFSVYNADLIENQFTLQEIERLKFEGYLIERQGRYIRL